MTSGRVFCAVWHWYVYFMRYGRWYCFSNEISNIMATVKPFKGLRPPKELVEQVASRPYDVLNSAEARAEAKGNEKSLYHIIKPEIDFPEGTDEHDPRVYDKAVENFRMFQEKG